MSRRPREAALRSGLRPPLQSASRGQHVLGFRLVLPGDFSRAQMTVHFKQLTISTQGVNFHGQWGVSFGVP